MPLALVATIAVVATVAPGDAQAFAWKDVCTITVFNNTGSLGGLKPKGPLVQIPPNPIDEVKWTAFGTPLGPIGIPPAAAGGLSLVTVGIPLTLGCRMTPTFKWGSNGAVACIV